MKRVGFILCLAAAFVTFGALADNASSSKVSSSSLSSEVAANQVSWEYGYLKASARCSGKKVKVVSQIFRWCRADFEMDGDKFEEANKYDVHRALRDSCGSAEYVQSSYILVSRFSKSAAEKERKFDIENCDQCEKIDTFQCSSCEAYSSKCK